MDRRADRLAGRAMGFLLVPTREFRQTADPGRPGLDEAPPIGTGPALSDFYPWQWAPYSSKILIMPDDGSTPSAYLVDPKGGDWSTVPFDFGASLDWQRLAP